MKEGQDWGRQRRKKEKGRKKEGQRRGGKKEEEKLGGKAERKRDKYWRILKREEIMIHINRRKTKK